MNVKIIAVAMLVSLVIQSNHSLAQDVPCYEDTTISVSGQVPRQELDVKGEFEYFLQECIFWYEDNDTEETTYIVVSAGGEQNEFTVPTQEGIPAYRNFISRPESSGLMLINVDEANHEVIVSYVAGPAFELGYESLVFTYEGSFEAAGLNADKTVLVIITKTQVTIWAAMEGEVGMIDSMDLPEGYDFDVTDVHATRKGDLREDSPPGWYVEAIVDGEQRNFIITLKEEPEPTAPRREFF